MHLHLKLGHIQCTYIAACCVSYNCPTSPRLEVPCQPVLGSVHTHLVRTSKKECLDQLSMVHLHLQGGTVERLRSQKEQAERMLKKYIKYDPGLKQLIFVHISCYYDPCDLLVHSLLHLRLLVPPLLHMSKIHAC